MKFKNLIAFAIGAFLSLLILVFMSTLPRHIDECKSKGGVQVRGILSNSVCIKKEAVL